MPLLLTLYLGSVDLSQGIAADRKLASVAGAVGDLVAQTRDNLPQDTLDDYFSASQAIMLPFDGGQTAMLVTVVRVGTNGDATVHVSRGRNGATGLAQGAPFVLPDDIRSLAAGSFVVVSEAWYTYNPIIGYVMDAPINLYKQFFFMPRFGEAINIV